MKKLSHFAIDKVSFKKKFILSRVHKKKIVYCKLGQPFQKWKNKNCLLSNLVVFNVNVNKQCRNYLLPIWSSFWPNNHFYIELFIPITIKNVFEVKESICGIFTKTKKTGLPDPGTELPDIYSSIISPYQVTWKS